MVETKPDTGLNDENGDESDIEDLEAQLNEIEHALDNLESQNDNIHSKLKELLESNREVRKEMASFNNSGATATSSSSNSVNNSQQQKQSADISRLQQLHLNSTENSTSSNQ